jgi:hypothetical protein
MHPRLLIQSVLLLILLTGADVSSAQTASLAYKFSCMSNSSDNLVPQLGMLIEERTSGNAIGFHADFSGQSDTQDIVTKGVLNNGVNSVGEWVSLLGPCVNAPSLNDLMEAFANGQFKVGLHVKGIGLAGTADSYINQQSAVPLPAAAWLFSSALFGFIVFANRRKV